MLEESGLIWDTGVCRVGLGTEGVDGSKQNLK